MATRDIITAIKARGVRWTRHAAWETQHFRRKPRRVKALTGNEPSQVSLSAEELSAFQKDSDDVSQSALSADVRCK